MSTTDLWSDNLPTLPGRYWTRDITPGGYGTEEIATLRRNGKWYGEDGDEWLDADKLKGLVQVGPRVLSPTEL